MQLFVYHQLLFVKLRMLFFHIASCDNAFFL